MRVTIMRECGFLESLMGMGLSFNVTSGPVMDSFIAGYIEPDLAWLIIKRANVLAGKGGGHDKFLRQIMTWIYIKAPLYWWKQMDQYKVGTTTSSESTMHTIMKRNLTQSDFEDPIDDYTLDKLNVYIACGDFSKLNNELPQSYLQGRVWTGSYENIANIVNQRVGHKLPQWDFFINSLKTQLDHPELIWKGTLNETTVVE